MWSRLGSCDSKYTKLFNMISRDNFWSTENKHIENALNFFISSPWHHMKLWTAKERNQNNRKRTWIRHYRLCHWVFIKRKLRFHYQDRALATLLSTEKMNSLTRRPWIPFKSNKAIDEQWQGPTRTYYGTFHPKAPNFATFLGPMTGLGHNSIIFMIECQTQLLINALREMWDNKGLWPQMAFEKLCWPWILNDLFSTSNGDQGRSITRIRRRMESQNR